jgi:hypothetical protein
MGFGFGHDSTHFLRDEKVAEDSRRAVPSAANLPLRPKRGKFVAGKTRAHADHGVVARDVVATDGPQLPAAKQRPRSAPRFNGDE